MLDVCYLSLGGKTMGALQKYTGGIHDILPPPGTVADEPKPLAT